MSIRHVTPVPRRSATGRVAEVYAQSATDFGQIAFMMLSPAPDLHAAAWAVLRESELVGHAPRTDKEVVTVAVSQANECRFCIDAHTILIHATGDHQLHAAPPPGAYPGTSTHTITVANDASARATYQVIEVIERHASQPSSKPPSVASPGTTEATDPPATAVPGEPSDTASSAALAGSPKSGNAGTTVGLIGFGTVLFLVGAATLGFIAWQRRRPQLAARLASPRTAADTRPLPLRHRGVHRRY